MSDGAGIAITIGCLVAAVAILVGGLLLIGRQVDHHYKQSTCPERGEVMGRPTKFVDYTFWSYDCLAQADDGTWLSVDKFRAGDL
jgi:hypothetical protein